MNLTSADMTKLGIALGICFALYKFGPNDAIKAAGLAVGAVVVAKKVPYVSAAL
ncbi:hypothetical protein GTP45_10680 [Pseudoduganella sp. FT55W]|uniref:Uncharacterized protein n=1 Tax=Duganella rivi TaxID=2666083 RepID=A0A7X4GQG4_9BURK|nr:hypothetical protein [Duganella rivi]MYM67295.1 hypothetical protein [Duganella rivi]